MTDQEIFDTVYRHLLKQGRRATTGMRCAYRGDNGDRCAVGALIPDDAYSPQMEGQGVDGLCGISDWFRETFGVYATRCLLRDLQNMHDNTAPMVWAEMLAGLALKYDLTVPSMEPIPEPALA